MLTLQLLTKKFLIRKIFIVLKAQNVEQYHTIFQV